MPLPSNCAVVLPQLRSLLLAGLAGGSYPKRAAQHFAGQQWAVAADSRTVQGSIWQLAVIDRTPTKLLQACCCQWCHGLSHSSRGAVNAHCWKSLGHSSRRQVRSGSPPARWCDLRAALASLWAARCPPQSIWCRQRSRACGLPAAAQSSRCHLRWWRARSGHQTAELRSAQSRCRGPCSCRWPTSRYNGSWLRSPPRRWRSPV